MLVVAQRARRARCRGRHSCAEPAHGSAAPRGHVRTVGNKRATRWRRGPGRAWADQRGRERGGRPSLQGPRAGRGWGVRRRPFVAGAPGLPRRGKFVVKHSRRPMRQPRRQADVLLRFVLACLVELYMFAETGSSSVPALYDGGVPVAKKKRAACWLIHYSLRFATCSTGRILRSLAELTSLTIACHGF